MSNQYKNTLYWATAKMTKMLLCLYTVGDKNVALSAKGLSKRILKKLFLIFTLSSIIQEVS